MRRVALLAAVLVVAVPSASFAQSHPEFIALGRVSAALYTPDTGPAPHVGFVIGHRQAQSYIDAGQSDQKAFEDNARRLELRLVGLASRARRRVQGGAPVAERDLSQQRRVVDAFMAAAQKGDFEGLVAVLDPDIVLRADGGALAGLSRVVRGASAVASQASTFSRSGLSLQLVLVNGQLGFVARRGDGRLFSVIGFTIADGKIVEMDILADPERLSRLDLSAIED